MNGTKNNIFIFDTTLRDGTQSGGISFSCTDKLRLAEKLDDLGVSYIEGGWPGSNPRDAAFFTAARKLQFRHARLTAFGSTRRIGKTVDKDENLQALLQAETPVVSIFGKSWLLHVREVLHASPEENLDLIAESCQYLKAHGREVIFDAEHFFDGYKEDPEYAGKVLVAAASAGASCVTLCDTNGGAMPMEIAEICKDVLQILPETTFLGIHCHNDSELAVANSISAVRSGAKLVQGTINGFGERCGNANLCSIIPALQLKAGYGCLPDGKITLLKEVSYFVDDLANLRHDPRLPFVGDLAFAHKGGMHVNAVKKNPVTFEHIVPESVGNRRRILVSDLSGKSNIRIKAAELGIDPGTEEQAAELLAILKEKENTGYEYEAADASLALLMYKTLHKWTPFFTLEGFRVIVEKRKYDDGTAIAEATVKLSVNGVSRLMAAEGDGPVNALDLALRKALERFYPEISGIHLLDYKVRIMEGVNGTAARTRVLIDSTDGAKIWGTVGVSENIIQASWEALVDSVEYVLYRMNAKPVNPDMESNG
ncbi:MAG: citramalate synthase [Lentisphaeria bacterium]|nr:citramalate synthase [Lentisphaeria bacterium]